MAQAHAGMKRFRDESSNLGVEAQEVELQIKVDLHVKYKFSYDDLDKVIATFPEEERLKSLREFVDLVAPLWSWGTSRSHILWIVREGGGLEKLRIYYRDKEHTQTLIKDLMNFYFSQEQCEVMMADEELLENLNEVAVNEAFTYLFEKHFKHDEIVYLMHWNGGLRNLKEINSRIRDLVDMGFNAAEIVEVAQYRTLLEQLRIAKRLRELFNMPHKDVLALLNFPEVLTWLNTFVQMVKGLVPLGFTLSDVVALTVCGGKSGTDLRKFFSGILCMHELGFMVEEIYFFGSNERKKNFILSIDICFKLLKALRLTPNNRLFEKNFLSGFKLVFCRLRELGFSEGQLETLAAITGGNLENFLKADADIRKNLSLLRLLKFNEDQIVSLFEDGKGRENLALLSQHSEELQRCSIEPARILAALSEGDSGFQKLFTLSVSPSFAGLDGVVAPVLLPLENDERRMIPVSLIPGGTVAVPIADLMVGGYPSSPFSEEHDRASQSLAAPN